MSLKIKKRQKGNTEILKISGEATTEEIYKLSNALKEARERGAKNIALDVSEATFLDSSALGVLILNSKILSRDDGKIRLLFPTPYIKEMLRDTNLEAVFEQVEREEEL